MKFRLFSFSPVCDNDDCSATFCDTLHLATLKPVAQPARKFSPAMQILNYHFFTNNMIASVSFVSTGTFTDVFPPTTGMRIFSSKRPSSIYS